MYPIIKHNIKKILLLENLRKIKYNKINIRWYSEI